MRKVQKRTSRSGDGGGRARRLGKGAEKLFENRSTGQMASTCLASNCLFLPEPVVARIGVAEPLGMVSA